MFARLRKIGEGLKREIAFYRCVLNHPGTPRFSRYVLWIAIAYVLLPFDLIPDFIPVIGHLDDLVIIPFLVFLALKFVPPEITRECRSPLARTEVSDNP